jgi:ABC-2 type transport system permease protein
VIQLTKSLTRILALVGKELLEVVRRPGAMISLVLGPFFILAVFGLGYGGGRVALRTVVVVPPDAGLPAEPAAYEAFQARGLQVTEVSTNEVLARQQLANGAIDIVVVVPADARASLEAGKQADLEILMNLTDPVMANYAGFLADTLAGEVNRELYRRAAEEGRGYVISVGGRALENIPPEVIASPVRAAPENIAPTRPAILPFFGLAALALVLQHMAVSLVALSVVRERRSGAMDLFRLAPVRATELVLGKLLAYGLLGALVAGVSTFLLVGLLGVPMLGSPPLVAAIVGLLLLASLGLGLLIAVISDSERQAVQLSLLVLLASMFFSGFVLRIAEFTIPVQVGAYFLPVTHGIGLLQDLLLRGTIVQGWQVAALAVIAGVLLITSWGLLRREMRPA